LWAEDPVSLRCWGTTHGFIKKKSNKHSDFGMIFYMNLVAVGDQVVAKHLESIFQKKKWLGRPKRLIKCGVDGILQKKMRDKTQ
jgi:hypothetical protein